MGAREISKLRLLKPEEVADRLGVSTLTIKKWLRNGKLPGVKVGHLWRIDEADLEKFIEAGKGNSKRKNRGTV